jgi:anti-anti-sigma factor
VSGDLPVVWAGRVAVIKIPAEVDLSNADQVRRDLTAALAQDASLVIADMSATTFCDSAGVIALVRAVRNANASGTGLRVAASAPAVTRVLAITGVDGLIEVYPSVAAAMAGPGTGTAHEGLAVHPGCAGHADPGGRAALPD